MPYRLITAERVRHLLADRPDFAEKKMMGGIAFMVKGGMCCMVSGRSGVLVRVGAEAAAKLVKEPHVMPMRMGSRIVKNFIRVMPEAYRTPAQLRKWVERAVTFTTTLPEKTKRGRPRQPARPRRAA